MAAETQYTANTGVAKLANANTNLDGSGSYVVTVITGGTYGTLVKTLTIKAQGNTTQGMVRLFIYDGGSNTRLIAEVEVPTVTCSATEETFEQRLELDLHLQHNYVLKATTQNSETFSVIAEGLDWNYFSAAVRPESANYTASTSGVLTVTGNSNRDGTTGNYYKVIAADASSNGCCIDSITIKAIVNTADGMVRLFLKNPNAPVTTTRTLLTEIKIPAITKSGTARSFVHQINFPNGFEIAPECEIWASTENTEGFQVVADARDWVYPVTGESCVLAQNFSPVSGTSTTSEELLQSYYIDPGLIATGDILEVYADLLINNNANNKTFRIYINSANSLTTPTPKKVATYTTLSTVADAMQRFFPVISDTALECQAGDANSIRTNYTTATGTSANVTSITSLSAGFWILISGEKAVAGDTDTIRWSMVRNNRM